MPITYDITTDGLYLRGKVEGREEGREATMEMMIMAMDLLRAGKSVEEVAETTQLPVTTIHRIRKNLNN